MNPAGHDLLCLLGRSRCRIDGHHGRHLCHVWTDFRLCARASSPALDCGPGPGCGPSRGSSPSLSPASASYSGCCGPSAGPGAERGPGGAGTGSASKERGSACVVERLNDAGPKSRSERKGSGDAERVTRTSGGEGETLTCVEGKFGPRLWWIWESWTFFETEAAKHFLIFPPTSPHAWPYGSCLSALCACPFCPCVSLRLCLAPSPSASPQTSPCSCVWFCVSCPVVDLEAPGEGGWASGGPSSYPL